MNWEEIARRKSGFSLARFQRCDLTGKSATVKVFGILKLSPDRSEFELLQEFKRLLGSQYPSIFPRFHELGEIEGQYVMELEYVGDINLEEVLLAERTSPTSAKAVVEQISTFINQLADVQPNSAGTVTGNYKQSFLNEIVSGLTRNVEASGLTIELASHDRFLQRAVFNPTLCHRDLSATNIMCEAGGTSRLIDPRWVVPGAVCQPLIYGSVAIDCASFQVSLERKEVERKRLERPDLGLADLFKAKTTVALLQQGIFNEFMYDLCLAYSYSIYTACRCEYCLAPERRWLYELMRKQLQNSLRRIT